MIETMERNAANGTSPVSLQEMHGAAPVGAKDAWVFNAEATSTLLIAAWYVFGVGITLGVIPASAFHAWGDHWVIPFLLAVFYGGAGYLYQRHQSVTSFKSQGAYLRREAVVLLVPFFSFLVLTLLTTSVAALQPGLVASGLATGEPTFNLPDLVHAIFVKPVGPVGYFVVLLSILLITRTPRTRRGTAALLCAALAAKAAAIILTDAGMAECVPYYLLGILDNWIWFALGVATCSFRLQDALARPLTAACSVGAFVILGTALLAFGITEAALMAALTLTGLFAFYSVSGARFLQGAQSRFYGFVTRYTMAIWLMHQILSTLAFCALYALGFHAGGPFDALWIPVNAVTCLIACYPLPVLVMEALSHLGKLGFIVYPSRYLPASFGKR